MLGFGVRASLPRRKIRMVVHFIAVQGMSRGDLVNFVRKNNLSFQALLAQAKEARLPEKCPDCGEKLTDMVRAYRKVPTDDLTLRVVHIAQRATVSQIVEDRPAHCRQIQDKLRAIVQEHLVQLLNKAGYETRCHSTSGLY